MEEKKADALTDDKDNTKADEDLDEKGDEDDEERGTSDQASRDDPRDLPAEPAHAGRGNEGTEKEEGDSGIDANSQGSCSSGDTKGTEKKDKDKKKKKSSSPLGNKERVEELDIEEDVDIGGCEGAMSTADGDVAPSIPAARTALPSGNAVVTVSQRRALVPNRQTSTRLAKAEHHRVQGNDAREVRASREIAGGESGGSTTDLTMNTIDQGVSRSGSRVMDGLSCNTSIRGRLAYESSRHPAEREDFEATGNETYIPAKGKKILCNYVHFGDGEATNREANVSKLPNSTSSLTSPKQGGKREEGWKEVVRNSCVRSKKVSVPSTAISRVIGRGGSNINAIRAATSAHIEVEKQNKGQGERVITIKGSADATRQAHALITALVKDPEADLQVILPGAATVGVVTSSVAKVPSGPGLPPTITWCHDPKATSVANSALAKVKPPSGPGKGPTSGTVNLTNSSLPRTINSVVGSTVSPLVSAIRGANNAKMGINFPVPAISRGTPPRLAAAAEKRAAAAAVLGGTKSTMSYTTAITTAGRATKIVTTTTTQTFAAKLTETTAGGIGGSISGGGQTSVPVSVQGPGPRGPVVQGGGQRVARPQSPRQRQPLLQPPLGATVPVLPPPPTNIQSPKCAVSPPGVVLSIGQGVPSRPGAVGGRYRASGASVPFPANTSSPCQVAPPSSPINLDLGRGNSVGRRREQPPPMSSPSVTTPKEYSLFNNIFGKVTQQTMWGQGNEVQSKGMNFAGAAASGSSPPTATTTGKFLDSGPPQVDVSKAPGYRGMAARSPVSNSANSPHENPGAPRTTSVPTSDALTTPYSSVPDLVELAESSVTMQGASLRQRPVGHGAPTSVRPTNMESVGSLCGRQQRPQARQTPTVESSSYRQSVFAERDVLPRGALMHLHGHHGPLDAGGPPFPPSASTYGSENSLLKLVRQRNGTGNISQQLGGGESLNNMPTFQNPGPQAMTHFQSGSSVSVNSVVTTNASIHSRLNPRAPDFSISPLSGQRQQIAFNATPAAYHGTPPPVRQGSGPGLATLLANGGVVPFPIVQQGPSTVGKPHSQVGGPAGNYPRASHGSHPGGSDNSHHAPNHPAARWPYMATAPHHPFHPQAHHRGQGEQVNPGAFPGAVGSHFAALAGLASHHHPGGAPDPMGNVENGNAVHQLHNPGIHLHAVHHHPHVSPAPPSGSRSPSGSDTVGPPHGNINKPGSQSVGTEDRRSRPMPIGTERACWKSYSVSGGGTMGEQDVMTGGWMQAEPSMPWQRQHHQLFGGTIPPHPYGRPPPREDSSMSDGGPVDGAYQGMHHPPHHHPHHHLGDGRPPQFPNGSGTNVSPMHGGVSAVLAYGGGVTDVGVPTSPPTSVTELVMKVDGVGDQSEWETGPGSRAGLPEVNEKRSVTFDTRVPLQGHHTPVPLQAHQRYRLMIDKDGGPQPEKGLLW